MQAKEHTKLIWILTLLSLKLFLHSKSLFSLLGFLSNLKCVYPHSEALKSMEGNMEGKFERAALDSRLAHMIDIKTNTLKQKHYYKC